MAEATKCAHEACTCKTTEKYCSEYCKDHSDTVEIACKCGHAGCSGDLT